MGVVQLVQARKDRYYKKVHVSPEISSVFIWPVNKFLGSINFIFLVLGWFF